MDKLDNKYKLPPFDAESFNFNEENIFVLPTDSAKPIKVYFDGNIEIREYRNEEYNGYMPLKNWIVFHLQERKYKYNA